jgi:hypothetical protein
VWEPWVVVVGFVTGAGTVNEEDGDGVKLGVGSSARMCNRHESEEEPVEPSTSSVHRKGTLT